MAIRLTFVCLFVIAALLQIFVAMFWFLTHSENNFHNASFIEWFVIFLLLLVMNLIFAYYRSRKILFFIDQKEIQYEKGTKLIIIKWTEVSQIQIKKLLFIPYFQLILKNGNTYNLNTFCIVKQHKQYIEEVIRNYNAN